MVNRRNGLYWFDLLLAVVAGIWTLFHVIWSISGQTSDDYWGIALLILFLLALIVAFVHFAQERSILRTESSAERFPEPAISKFFLASVGSAVLWFVVRMYVGTEWFLAGWNIQCESDTGNAWLVPGALLESLRLDRL